MRMLLLGCVGLLFALLGCSDNPTALTSGSSGEVLTECQPGPNGENCYVLPPVAGGPTVPECDPWLDPSWCQGGGTECLESIGTSEPLDFIRLSSCNPRGGVPGAPGGGGPTDPDPEEDEVDSDICPQPLRGRTLPYLATIAGRRHEFTFRGPMRRLDGGRSPSRYNISGPTASKDNWWIAESGTIRLVCWGGWRFRRSVWIGTVVVQDDDLHFVMGPGHPDFFNQPPYPPN